MRVMRFITFLRVSSVMFGDVSPVSGEDPDFCPFCTKLQRRFWGKYRLFGRAASGIMG
jgi:hypothetical protein